MDSQKVTITREDGKIEILKEFDIDDEFKLKYNEIEDEWDRFQNEVIIPKISRKLYKYYSANMNNIDALMNQYFYLANPTSFNDPFDCNVNLTPEIDEGLKELMGLEKIILPTLVLHLSQRLLITHTLEYLVFVTERGFILAEPDFKL